MIIVTVSCLIGTKINWKESSVSNIMLHNIEALTQEADNTNSKYVRVFKASGNCLKVKPGENGQNEVISTDNIWITCKKIKREEGKNYNECTEVNCPDGEFYY